MATQDSGIDPGPPTVSPAGWLNNRRIIHRPRPVVLATNYRLPAAGALSPEAKNDLDVLIDLMEAGKPIPERYYRSGIDTYRDRMLLDYGINHLHLLDPGSDEIVFLVQFEHQVVLLKIGNHSDMEDSPPGSALRRAHDRCLQLAEMQVRQAAAKRSKQAAAAAERVEGARDRQKAAGLQALSAAGARRRKLSRDGET